MGGQPQILAIFARMLQIQNDVNSFQSNLTIMQGSSSIEDNDEQEPRYDLIYLYMCLYAVLPEATSPTSDVV